MGSYVSFYSYALFPCINDAFRPILSVATQSTLLLLLVTLPRSCGVGGSAHTRLLCRLDRFTLRSNSRPRFVLQDPLVINSQRNFIYLVFIYFVLLVDTPSAVSLQTSEVSSILYHSYCSLYLSCTSSHSLAFLQVHTNTFQPFLFKCLSSCSLMFLQIMRPEFY
jgi:hypothetical protein